MYKAEAKNVNFFYGDFHALKDITLSFPDKTVTALIGPSGCGKSTFLRLFNRMNDLIDHVKLEGEVLVNGQDIYSKDIVIDELRKSVGMVFQNFNLWGHRTVNTGDEPLVSFCVYPGEAGHNYGDIEKEGFPERVFKRAGKVEFVSTKAR